MMAASGIKASALKSSLKELINSLVGASRHAAVKGDAVFPEELLPASADAAADESVDALILKEEHDVAVLRPAGVLYLRPPFRPQSRRT